MASREQNEQKFGHWEELPNGGRRYFRDFLGRSAGALVTSKKWTRPKERFDLLRKFMIRLVVLWPCTRNFPSI
jgi:hypothetical protein